MAIVSEKVLPGITLKGSCEIVAEYFDYAINSILYQRGIYPEESFNKVEKYGLSLLMVTDKEIKQFLSAYLEKVKEMLESKKVNKLVLVIINLEGEPMERWEFNVEDDQTYDNISPSKKPDIKEIRNGIREVIRQIISTIGIVPLLDEPCKIDILMYTTPDVETPADWCESQPFLIENGQVVSMRSLTTSVHKVHTQVTYKHD